MKLFEVKWSSTGNLEKGCVIVRAINIVEAQNKFWLYMQKQPVFEHMWQLSFKFIEIQETTVIE